MFVNKLEVNKLESRHRCVVCKRFILDTLPLNLTLKQLIDSIDFCLLDLLRQFFGPQSVPLTPSFSYLERIPIFKRKVFTQVYTCTPAHLVSSLGLRVISPSMQTPIRLKIQRLSMENASFKLSCDIQLSGGPTFQPSFCMSAPIFQFVLSFNGKIQRDL